MLAQRSATLRVAAALLVSGATLLPAAPAWAHNELLASTPADGATLADPPREVTLTFVERLDSQFTQIVVTDAARSPVSTGEPSVSGTTGRLALPVDLADGTYIAAFRVVSLDGHPVQGAIRFTVGTPTAPSPTPVAAEPVRNTDRTAWWLTGIATGIIVLGGALLARRRVARR